MKQFLYYHFKSMVDGPSLKGLIAVDDIEEIYEVSTGGVIIFTKNGMKKVVTDTFPVLLKQLKEPASSDPPDVTMRRLT